MLDTWQQLLEEDQSENRSVVVGTPEYRVLRERDAARRQRVREGLLVEGDLTPEALYAAAWILNHGDEVQEAALAHVLARRAALAGFEPAKWLCAAADDRSRMYAGQPQKYGTNSVPDGRGYRLWDVDPKTTDAERAAWNVPPLAELQRRVEVLSRTAPQPPLEDAPRWLREAIARWYPHE